MRRNKSMSLIRKSRLLSFILRHNTGSIKVNLDEHGWAYIQDIVMATEKVFTSEIIKQIVVEDDKQRYELSLDKNRIRAVQGHSIEVDVELEEKRPPEYLFHGTTIQNLFSIMKSGLTRQKRLYVHMHNNPEQAKKSGERKGIPAVFLILAEDMYYNEFKFFRAKNGIWLTEIIPVEYLRYSYHYIGK